MDCPARRGGRFVKDGVDDVDEEVDDEQMDEVITGQGGGGDEVQRQLGLQ